MLRPIMAGVDARGIVVEHPRAIEYQRKHRGVVELIEFIDAPVELARGSGIGKDIEWERAKAVLFLEGSGIDGVPDDDGVERHIGRAGEEEARRGDRFAMLDSES